jgi:hypothetical protein
MPIFLKKLSAARLKTKLGGRILYEMMGFYLKTYLSIKN